MTRPILSAEFAEAAPAIDDCWARIGIHGDKTCPELAGHSHCRNCPTFSWAAAVLLDRDLPDHVQISLADRSEATVVAAEAQAESLMIFRVASEWFALPTLVLDEIVALRPIHTLPHRRNPALLGITNVRGELVTCISIAQLLAGATGSLDPRARLIVVRHASERFACPVDEVAHTHHCTPGELEPVPVTVAHSASNFSQGLLSWRGRSVGRLDERLLFDALNRCLT